MTKINFTWPKAGQTIKLWCNEVLECQKTRFFDTQNVRQDSLMTMLPGSVLYKSTFRVNFQQVQTLIMGMQYCLTTK